MAEFVDDDGIGVHQTWLFALASTAFAASCVIAIVQRRTQYLRRQQRRLEALVAARTSELEARTAVLEASKREIEQIANHDSLTGLPNRPMFTEQMDKLFAIAEWQGRQFALLMIDFDRLKKSTIPSVTMLAMHFLSRLRGGCRQFSGFRTASQGWAATNSSFSCALSPTHCAARKQ